MEPFPSTTTAQKKALVVIDVGELPGPRSLRVTPSEPPLRGIVFLGLEGAIV